MGAYESPTDGKQVCFPPLPSLPPPSPERSIVHSKAVAIHGDRSGTCRGSISRRGSNGLAGCIACVRRATTWDEVGGMTVAATRRSMRQKECEQSMEMGRNDRKPLSQFQTYVYTRFLPPSPSPSLPPSFPPSHVPRTLEDSLHKVAATSSSLSTRRAYHRQATATASRTVSEERKDREAEEKRVREGGR